MFGLTTFAFASAVAQTSEVPAQVGRELEIRVAVVVAERWQVESEQVVLQWGHVRDGMQLEPDTPFEIRGRTAGTNFTLVFSPKNTPPIAVGLRAGLRMTVPVTTRPPID